MTTSETGLATVVAVAAAGALGSPCPGTDPSNEERMKSIHAAATIPRRSHFLLKVHAASSLSRAGSFSAKAHGMRITARRKTIVCSASPVNSREKTGQQVARTLPPGQD
ncbi:hypothetical protein ACQ86N_15610 [Puia sp. P3]|uniref:hypothetical protein n=1 Tax=Puia sp. P3 TaxID=3423952 RepID=UPI003D675BCD